MRWTHALTVTAVALAGVSGVSGVSLVGAGSWAAPVRAAAIRNASVESVSCASPGNCSAGGFYNAGVLNTQAFVVGERNWHWGKAIEVPGTAALNVGGSAEVDSISCASARNCAAGGLYAPALHTVSAFVVSEKNGQWGKAIQIPGLARLKVYAIADVRSVSCASVGNCSADGHYIERSRHIPRPSGVFVVSEKHGRWGNAIQMPGTATLSNVSVSSLSCGAAGDCSAVGGYDDRSGNGQAFVISEKNWHWGKAIEMPGFGRLNHGNGGATSVSCTAPGDCAAGGVYEDGASFLQAFVASEKNWHWGKPIEVPGSGRLNSGGGNGGDAEVASLSCAAPGDCGAGGFYTDGSGNEQAFVVSENSGRWGNAIEVPGSGPLNAQGVAQILSMSCAAPGDCGAGGFYSDRSGNVQAFVVSENSARWGNAIEVPGSGRLNASGNTEVSSVSCAAPGDCAVGGMAAGAGLQGFVVSQRNGVWGEAAKIRF